jgi:hypothetical protein
MVSIMLERFTFPRTVFAVIVGGGIVLLWAEAVAPSAVRAESPRDGAGAFFPQSPPTQIPTPPVWDDPRREKMVTNFQRRLGQLKPVGKGAKKSPDDYYLLAVAELTLPAKHADVWFQVLQGQRKTAEFLVDYSAGASDTVLRKWHVFARFKDADEADAALAAARMQYDQMVAYRQRLEQIYSAASSRRC